MGNPEDVFFKSTLKKVLFLIGEYLEHHTPNEAMGAGATPVQTVTSMSQLKSMMRGG